MGYFSHELQEQFNTLMLPILALIGLGFSAGIDPYVKKEVKRIILVIDGVVFTIILACCVSRAVEAVWDPAYIMLQTAISVYCYIMRPVTIVLFTYIVWDDPRRHWFWIPAGVNAAVYLTAFFRPWAFFINSNGSFCRGPIGYTAHSISFALLSANLIVTHAQFRKIRGIEKLIPFRKELDHTLVYAQIETERFPNIQLDYEIEDEEFLLPALTMQPLVENAIRHGVRGMEKGQVDIVTNQLPECHEILIRDNGKGFSVMEATVTGGSHIGIQNVRERLERLCGGTMVIESETGHGTCVIIHIPRGKECL